MKIQPPPWLHNLFIEIMEVPSQNRHLEDVAAPPWTSAASLDLCRGTRLADVDGADEDEAMGTTDKLLGIHGH
jgi:hypothetical protein